MKKQTKQVELTWDMYSTIEKYQNLGGGTPYYRQQKLVQQLRSRIKKL